MRTIPGTMKPTPPTIAPGAPRRRQAQKIASCVEAGPRQQVGGRDPVLELLGVEPVAPLDAQPAQERDVRWGSSEADAAETQPLERDGARAARARG